MKTYTLSVLVSVDLAFSNDEAAKEWAEEHTVFDMLDKGAGVGEVVITPIEGD